MKLETKILAIAVLAAGILFLQSSVSAHSPNNAPLTPPTPSGPSTCQVNQLCTYTFTQTSDPDGDRFNTEIDWGDGTVNDCHSDRVPAGGNCSLQHAWYNSGNYCLKTRAYDEHVAISGSSGCFNVAVGGGANRPPTAPDVPDCGTTTVTVNTTYQCWSAATDPDGDQVQITFHNGEQSFDSGFVGSGQRATVNITWNSTGNKCLKAVATDSNSNSSAWTVCRNITVGSGSSQPPASDTIPPNVSYSVPDPASGTVTIRVSASDSGGVSKIYLYIDDVLKSQNSNSTSLSYSWNTTAYSDGTHKIHAWAQDTAGNYGTTQTPTYVTVNNGGAVNQRPNNPDVPTGGPAGGKGTVGVNYTFYTRAVDPEGDRIRVIFNWSDSPQTYHYTNYLASGSTFSAAHSWSRASGAPYCVQAKAQSVDGQESGWSGCLDITITEATVPPAQPTPAPTPTPTPPSTPPPAAGTKPSAPSSLVFATLSCGQGTANIRITWRDNASNEDGFYIYKYQANVDSNWTRIGQVGAGVNRWEGNVQQVAQYYLVEAYNTYGSASSYETDGYTAYIPECGGASPVPAPPATPTPTPPVGGVTPTPTPTPIPTPIPNSAPSVPEKPQGVAIAQVGQSYTFSARASDADNDRIKMTFAFVKSPGSDQVCQGNLVCRESPFSSSGCYSGCTLAASHIFNEAETYYVFAIATDQKGTTSERWSDIPLVVEAQAPGAATPKPTPLPTLKPTGPVDIQYYQINQNQTLGVKTQAAGAVLAENTSGPPSNAIRINDLPDGTVHKPYLGENSAVGIWVFITEQNSYARSDETSFKITPSLPPGLTFNDGTDIIDGVPTVDGTYDLTITTTITAQTQTGSKQYFSERKDTIVIHPSDFQTGDITPPVDVKIISPEQNAGFYVGGDVVVKFSGKDNETGIGSLELYVDGKYYQALATGAGQDLYQFVWRKEDITVGNHSLYVIAYDRASPKPNPTASHVVNVTVRADTPPTVTIVEPVDGATVFGVVTVKVKAEDNFGVRAVELYVDGVYPGDGYTDNQPNAEGFYEIPWDTTNPRFPEGQHILKVLAYDTNNNPKDASISVMVSNSYTLSSSEQSCPNITFSWSPQASGNVTLKILKSGNEVASIYVGGLSSSRYTWKGVGEGTYDAGLFVKGSQVSNTASENCIRVASSIGYTIPIRETSIQVVNRDYVLKTWGASEANLNYVINSAIANGWNPAFLTALWIEESGGTNNIGYLKTGCMASIVDNLTCFYNDPTYKDMTDFETFVRYWCGPNQPVICGNNPRFLGNLRGVYNQLVSDTNRVYFDNKLLAYEII